MGRGGGYYDRFLSQYRSSAVLLCRERLIREEIPVEPHDCPVPWVLTEQGLYEDGVPPDWDKSLVKSANIPVNIGEFPVKICLVKDCFIP